VLGTAAGVLLGAVVLGALLGVSAACKGGGVETELAGYVWVDGWNADVVLAPHPVRRAPDRISPAIPPVTYRFFIFFISFCLSFPGGPWLFP
jgi:hypothetical protein